MHPAETVAVEPPLPPDDIEYRYAYRLLGKDNTLDREVLLSLVGRPRRYTDLKPLLGGRADHNLTMALDRLHRDGIVRKRSDVRVSPPIDHWELSELGRLVVLRMMQMLPAYTAAEMVLRGRGASEGDADAEPGGRAAGDAHPGAGDAADGETRAEEAAAESG